MSMKIQFTIIGNHEDQRGNAIPKIKKTAWQQWTPEAHRYAAWKEHVQLAFLDAVKKEHPELSQRIGYSMARNKKPIELEALEKARMDIKIWWKNEAHADSENVFGSIADALFKNDKKLDGSFEGARSPDNNGRVEILITLIQ